MKKYFLTLIAVIGFITSCNDNLETIDIGPNYDRASLLENWFNNHINPSYNNFSDELSQFNSDVLDAKDNGLDESRLEILRNSFNRAYKAWQYVEMFNIGKAEEIYYSSTINIYPVNVPRIESNVTSGNYDLNNANNYAAQGLPTIDYLLYGIGESNSEIIEKLNNTNYINYLVALTNQMSINTSSVINDWETYKSEFLSSTDNTATSAVNMMVNDFIYYYEKGFRANKFGIPGGVFSSTPIPENLESYFSGSSKALSIEAMSAIKNFFVGKHPFNGNTYSGSSLKSIVLELDENLGQNNLATRISDKIDVAIEKINELDENYYSQIQNDNNKFLQTYDAIQEVVVLLKVDMLQLLSINVDYVDADGD